MGEPLQTPQLRRTISSTRFRVARHTVRDWCVWRTGNKQGAAIEVEVWELPVREFGSFVAGIPAPLGIGTIILADGAAVQGFVCEHYAVG